MTRAPGGASLMAGHGRTRPARPRRRRRLEAGAHRCHPLPREGALARAAGRLLGLRRHAVTQATLSRDLDELGVVRLRAADGTLVYALPGEPGGPGSPARYLLRLSRTRAADSGRPPLPAEAEARDHRPAGHRDAGNRRGRAPGAADQVPQGAADLRGGKRQPRRAADPGRRGAVPRLGHRPRRVAAVLGTVAGDDTVLVIARDPAGGDALAAEFLLAHRTALISPGGYTPKAAPRSPRQAG